MMADRIASLVPSATETLFALGLGDRVVAVSHGCDQPPEVKRLPRASKTIVQATVPPATIDAEVRDHMADGSSLFTVDPEVLIQVQPDLIVAQDACEMCGVRPNDVERVITDWEGERRPRVVTVHAHTIHGVFEDILSLGGAAGAEDAARTFVARLRGRVDEVRSAVRGLKRPSVVVFDWLDPVMVAGHWVPEMVEVAGGRPLLVRGGEPSRYAHWHELADVGPEVVVLAPCGYDLTRVKRESEIIARGAGWDALPAVQQDRVYAVEADHYFSRPGPRLVDAVEMLAATLHPEHVEPVIGQERAFQRMPGL